MSPGSLKDLEAIRRAAREKNLRSAAILACVGQNTIAKFFNEVAEGLRRNQFVISKSAEAGPSVAWRTDDDLGFAFVLYY